MNRTSDVVKTKPFLSMGLFLPFNDEPISKSEFSNRFRTIENPDRVDNIFRSRTHL